MKRNPIVIFLMSVLCVMTLAFSGCGSDDGKLHDGYYRDVVMQANGEFIGKGKLSESEATKAGNIYKVEMSKDNKDQVARITAMYGDKVVRSALWKTKEGMWDGNFSTILVTPQENGYMKYEFLDVDGDPCSGFFNAYSIRFKEDEKDKRVTAAYLYNAEGEAKSEDISQLLFSYDDKERLHKITAANENGSPTKINSIGEGRAVALLIKYDQKKENQISELTWVNAGGNAVNGKYWAHKVFTYDDKGRIAEETYLGPEGNPAIVKSSSGIILNFSWGNSMRTEFENIKAKAAGAGAVTKYTYEGDSTLPSRIDFFGKTGQSYGLENSGDISSIELSYDDKGNVVKYSTYGPDGIRKSVFEDEKIDTLVLSYDEAGNISKTVFYHGENKTPLQTGKYQNCNISEIQYTYDEHGRVTSAAYYDANGEPADAQIYGKIKYQKVAYRYNGKGQKPDTTLYTRDGTEVSNDPLQAIYGKYKMVNSRADINGAIFFELTPNECIYSIDPQYAAEHHLKPISEVHKVKYTVNISEITGKGKMNINNGSDIDVDISAGTLRTGILVYKRID